MKKNQPNNHRHILINLSLVKQRVLSRQETLKDIKFLRRVAQVYKNNPEVTSLISEIIKKL